MPKFGVTGRISGVKVEKTEFKKINTIIDNLRQLLYNKKQPARRGAGCHKKSRVR